MNLIREKTGIKGSYVIIFLIGSIIFVYFNIFENLITNLVGTVYPSFWTIKAIESKNKNDIKKWLTYWIVFGVFVIIDFFNIIIVKIFPYYFLMKIMFLIWLFMPGSNGCTIVYQLFVKKIFNSFEDSIDIYVDNIKYYATEYYKQVLSKLDPQEVYDMIPDDAILLCYEENDKFCHRHFFAFWQELFLGIRTSEVYENPVRETLTRLDRPEYLKNVMEEVIKENYDMHNFDTIKEAYEYNKKYNIKEIEEKRKYKEELMEKGLYGIVISKEKDKKDKKTLQYKLTS
jgi:receptor expression-enhancing protein 5/6